MDINLKDKSVIVLIVVNLLPLIGVFVFGWDAIMIVIFYCIETFIIGVFNIFKMIRSEAEIPAEHMQVNTSQTQLNQKSATNPGCIKGMLVPFFFFHYNIFVVIQTAMIIFISNQFSEQNFEISHFLEFEFLMNLFLLVLSHGYSYRKNYIGRKEYKRLSVSVLMFLPYKRVFVQQFTVILGSFFIILFQGPTGFLILLIILKIITDIRAHNKSHNKSIDFINNAIEIQKER